MEQVNDNSFVKLYRKLLFSEGLTANHVGVFVELLLMASYRDDAVRGVRRGQIRTTWDELSEVMKLNRQTVAYRVKALWNNGIIDVEATKKGGTLITIKNWDKYQNVME